jgi:hypothetical protein
MSSGSYIGETYIMKFKHKKWVYRCYLFAGAIAFMFILGTIIIGSMKLIGAI